MIAALIAAVCAYGSVVGLMAGEVIWPAMLLVPVVLFAWGAFRPWPCLLLTPAGLAFHGPLFGAQRVAWREIARIETPQVAHQSPRVTVWLAAPEGHSVLWLDLPEYDSLGSTLRDWRHRATASDPPAPAFALVREIERKRAWRARADRLSVVAAPVAILALFVLAAVL